MGLVYDPCLVSCVQRLGFAYSFPLAVGLRGLESSSVSKVGYFPFLLCSCPESVGLELPPVLLDGCGPFDCSPPLFLALESAGLVSCVEVLGFDCSFPLAVAWAPTGSWCSSSPYVFLPSAFLDSSTLR